MKPIPAIVESDVARHAAAVDQALSRVREAEQHAEQADRRAQSAHEAVRARKLELGRALIAARRCFPRASRNAKGWTDFLAVRRMTLEQAQDAMKYAGYVDETLAGASPDDPANLPTLREAGLDPRPREGERAVNGNGGSGDPARGTYCTPKSWAEAVGPWDLDPFSNPRSHVAAERRCMLENGGNGLLDLALPGSYSAVPAFGRADEIARVWIQPPYDICEQAIAHYGHTRFCALLRLDSSTAWFDKLIKLTAVIALPLERLEFEAPPGIETSANPYPHALYYADERDITDEIRRLCVLLRVEHHH